MESHWMYSAQQLWVILAQKKKKPLPRVILPLRRDTYVEYSLATMWLGASLMHEDPPSSWRCPQRLCQWHQSSYDGSILPATSPVTTFHVPEPHTFGWGTLMGSESCVCVLCFSNTSLNNPKDNDETTLSWGGCWLVLGKQVWWQQFQGESATWDSSDFHRWRRAPTMSPEQ